MWFAGLAVPFCVSGWLVGGGRLNDYVALYYFLSWGDDGFVKRGLVGTALEVLHVPRGEVSLTALAVGAVVLIGILLFRFVERELVDRDGSLAASYQLLLATSPAVFQQLGYDLGRFDGVGMLLLLLALPLVGASRPVPHKMFAVVLCLTGLLVHEAFFFMYLPVLVGVALVESARSTRFGGWLPATLLLMAAATLALVVAAGSSDLAAAAARDRAVAHGYNEDLAVLASGVLGRTTDTDTVRTWLSGRKNQVFVAMSSGLFLVYAGVYLRRARRLLARAGGQGDPRWAATALMLSPFGILPLYALGIDFHRWAACGIFNVLLVAVVLEGRYGDRSEPGWLARAPRRRVAGLVAASACVGPVGAHYAFPLVVRGLVWLKAAWPPLDDFLRAVFGDRQFFEVR